jgi:flagellar hook-associated protein 2
LSSLGNYSGTGAGNINSLADLGLSFDQNGHLQFDSGVFAAATSSSVTTALSFLGSSTGGGFLQAATTALTAVTDPTKGLITQETQSIAASLTTLTTKIGTEQAQLATFQANLTNQMAQADALIASLEQQTSQITSLFAAQQTISKSLSG